MFAYIQGVTVVGILSEQYPIEGLQYDLVVEVPEGQAVEVGDYYQEGVFKSHTTQVESHILTKLKFNQRFTILELASLEVNTDPVIRVLQKRLDMADYIDVLDPETQQGVGYLAQQGYIAPERVAEILRVN